jgi:uncharacterized NAD(P)/FAD-binding protein YdhS
MMVVMQGTPLPFASDLDKRPAYDVAIIGGGFSGVMTAVHLLRHCRSTASILLIERGEHLGRGLAFGTHTVQHLLNVPAKNMSAFADEPSHFLEWLQRHKNAEISPTAFVSRQWYGEYIGTLLAEQLRRPDSPSLQCVHEEVVTIERQNEALRLTMTDSSHHEARLVVLAVGNFPPPDPMPLRQLSSHRYARYAWSPEALDGITDSESILLIGSGLTAIDQVVALKGSGFKGTIYMLSRRGLLPALHNQGSSWPTEWTEELPNSIRPLVVEIRRQVCLAAERGVDWRAVIDSLRPATQRIWKNLDLAERKRFLRHVRCFWEVHRHRLAPEVGRALDELRQSGQLVMKAGRVLECVERNGQVEVSYRDRESTGTETLRVSRIVNCTGHETDARKIDSPVVKSLLDNHLARVDSSALGLDISEDGAVIDASGIASKSLFALGSARKGLLWESTAVPEIRVQAHALAELLAQALASSANSYETIASRPSRNKSVADRMA